MRSFAQTAPPDLCHKVVADIALLVAIRKDVDEMSKQTERKFNPRLSIEISEEQFFALQKLIPFGMKRQLFDVIVSDIIKLLENSNKREAVLGAIIGRVINVPESSFKTKGTIDGLSQDPA